MSWIALIFLTMSTWAADSSCEQKLQPESTAADTRVLSAFAFAKQTNPDKLKTFIQYLNGEKPMWGGMKLDDRSTEENREVARQAIALTLRNMGFRPEFEVFENGSNVILEITGSTAPREVVEFGAHYDTVNSGADDNAAGVALLLHLAELYKTNPPGRTVRLVFYDLEEKGCDGSCYRASEVKKDPRTFVGALIVDSLGYFPKKLKTKVVTAEIGQKDERMPLAREIFYQVRRLPIDRGVQLSAETLRVDPEAADHGSYWKENVPAILLARPQGEKYDSPHNHSYSDTSENMTWDYYVSSGRLFIELAGFVSRVQLPADVIALPEASSENRSFSLENEGQTLPKALLAEEPLEEEKPSSGGLFGWGGNKKEKTPRQDGPTLHGDTDLKEQMREAMRDAQEPLKEKNKKPKTEKPATEKPGFEDPLADTPKAKGKKKRGWLEGLIFPDGDF